jgi:hypothetical protein
MTQAENLRRPERPRLTLKIFLYALVDVVGMASLATGAVWLARGQTLFIIGFPTSMAEALLALVFGLALMLWAAAQILRELIQRPTGKTGEGD